MQLNKTSLVNICSKTSLMKYSLIGTYFMKTHLYCLPFSFQILPNFSPCSFCYLVSLTEWVMVPHLMCYLLLHDIMDLHMSNLGTLVSQGLCGVFYATRHQITEFQRMTLSLLILWFHITHTHAHTHTHIHTTNSTQHTEGQIDWHIFVNISYHHLLCAQSTCPYYTEWIIWWYQKSKFQSSTMSLLFRNY